MEEQIDRNVPSHNRIDRGLAAHNMSTQCSEAAMAAEVQSVYVRFVHNIAKVLSNESAF